MLRSLIAYLNKQDRTRPVPMFRQLKRVPSVEELEQRTLLSGNPPFDTSLALSVWTGGGPDNYWESPTNWRGGVPTQNSLVVISSKQGAVPFDVRIRPGDTIGVNRLKIDNAKLTLGLGSGLNVRSLFTASNANIVGGFPLPFFNPFTGITTVPLTLGTISVPQYGRVFLTNSTLSYVSMLDDGATQLSGGEIRGAILAFGAHSAVSIISSISITKQSSVTNSGVLTLAGEGARAGVNVAMANSQLTNLGTIINQSVTEFDDSTAAAGRSVITNKGTFLVDGITIVEPILNNAGIVHVQLKKGEETDPAAWAELLLKGGGREPGRFIADAQTQILFEHSFFASESQRYYRLGPRSTLEGSGTYEVDRGSHLVLAGSNLRVKNLFLGNSLTEKSVIEGSGVLIPESFAWEDGVITGIDVIIGKTCILDTSPVVAGGRMGGAKVLDNGVIYCLGTISFDFALTLTGASTVIVDGSAGGGGINVVNRGSDPAVIRRTGKLSALIFVRDGQLQVGLGKVEIEVPIIDTAGKAKVSTNGVLELPLALQQDNGDLTLSGGDVAALLVALVGGNLDGTGTIDGPVQETGSGTVTIAPGAQGVPGRISINGSDGNLGLGSSGIVNVKLGGYSAGSGFDQISVNGSACLNGTLNLSLITGFVPNVGDSFQIMTYGSYTGSFQTVTGAVFASGTKRFVIQYSATNLTLTVVSNSSVGPPTVTGLGTTTGSTAGGTAVTINGTNFMDANGKSLVTSVSFGATPGTNFTVNSATSITATSPPMAVGTVDVRVTTVNGTSATTSSDQFTYTLGSAPTVTGVTPSLASTAGVSQVVITGTNFNGTTAVTFGSVAASFFIVNSATQITAIAPAQASGTVDVTVTTYGSTSSTSSADRVTYPGIATITGLSPAFGISGGGTSVTVTGTSFTSATGVFFGTVPAVSFTINSDTSITAVAPFQPAGTYDINVIGASGTSALGSADRYTYAAAAAPAVSSLTNSTGTTAGGTLVTVNGSGFTGASSVLFGTTTATNFRINSDTQITVVAPPEAAGTVDVTVVTPTGTSAASSSDQFAYTNASVPTVTALNTNTGTTAGSAMVTITGTGFTGATGVNFGSTAASNFTVLSDTSIVATAPPQAAATVDVTVSIYSVTSATGAADQFIVTAAPVPAVSALDTATGSAAGGTVVTISGSNFTGATAVNFGSSAATDFTVLTDGSIEAIAPSGVAGTVDITVTTYSGTSSIGSADHFTYTAVAAPTLTSLGTSTGTTAGGTVALITGTGFTTASNVLFGGVQASDFVVNSDTQITATAPPQFAGTVDVTVANFGGASATNSSDRFTYTAATAPAITSLSVSSGTSAGGTAVTITGTNFTGAFGVNFGTTAADFVVNSDTSITAFAPPQAAGTYDITVTTFTGTSSSVTADHFTVTAASVPVVNSLATTTGTTAGGTLVTITGLHFNGATSVLFGTVAASFTINSDTSITAVSPPQAAASFYDVRVTTYGGTSAISSSDHFAYTAAATPSVAGVSPNTGTTPGGNQIVITGSAFTGATGVTFGSVAALDFTVNSDSSITATAPPEAAATVDIKVTTFSGTSSTVTADHYTYTNITASAPAVTGVSPNSGSTAGGRVVVITGTNFSGATAVKFGTTNATSFTINSDTQITATAPALSAGTVDIKVTTNNGTSSAVGADQFNALTTGVPNITSLGTTTGTTAGGTSVVINGTNFTGATSVMFGSVAASSYTINSSTMITATSPPEPAGLVDVSVTTPSGVSAIVSADHFTYTAASLPTITSLGTSSGSTAGGTSVVITGTNFTGATGVFFGGFAAASFTVNSATQITATSPPEWVGTVDVTVSTYAGTTGTVSGDRFSYTGATSPAVTSLGTSTGTTAGGTSVTITGTNFTGATSVLFGSVAAASFTVNSATSITATSPAQAAAVVDITVTTFTGTSASSSSDHFTYTNAAVPTVTGLGTTSGTTGGGTSVAITGTGFTGATGVNFGTVAAASFTVNSATSITAFSPPEAAGMVDVTVTTYSGTSSTGTADHYTYNAATAPAVTGVTATSGLTSGGTVVTITGTNFTGASAVNFGTTAASFFTVISDTSIVASSPAGAAGTIDITVTTPTGTSTTGSADHFTYNAVSAPTINSLNPSTGVSGGGAAVTITGTGFLNATGVSFGGTAASSFFIASDTVITAFAPPLPAGTYDVSVTVYGATSALNAADRFTVTPSLAPTVTAVSPSTGSTAGGTSVTITGTGFTGASSVLFGTVAAASFTVNSDTSITAVTPSEVAATGIDIVVSTPTGTSATSSSDHFTYTNAAVPTVTNLSQSGGSTAGGTVVTITGTGFTGATGVNFGTIAGAFTVNSDTRITATAPPEAAGLVDVTVVTPSGTSATGSADHYTYTNAATPAVTAVTPNAGTTAGGTTVTVTGSGFTGASAVNFNTTAASSFTVLSDTALTAVAPAGSAGVVDITVVTPSGTSSTGSADHFTYAAPSTPTVTAVSPTSGSTGGGTVIILTGTGFTGATGVNFGSYAAASLTVNSDTKVTAVAPAQAAATVDITLTTVAGTSATGSGDQFTYSAAAAPTVTAVSPNGGRLTGGNSITITGTGFTGATGVKFGTVAATSFTVNSDGSIFAVAPAESAGTVDITVTTPSGTSSTGSADHYVYAADAALGAVQAVNISATVNVPFNGQVTQFTDSEGNPDTSQFTAVINWGDGHVTSGTLTYLGTGVFKITGSNTYTATGTYSVSVQIYDVDGSSATATGTATVGHGMAPTRAGPTGTGTQATATHGIAFGGLLASFLDSGSSGPASSFTVNINWGDGHTSAGKVTPNDNGGFDVSGSNTYATAGVYTVQIQITDANGVSTTITDTITVSDASATKDGDDLRLTDLRTEELLALDSHAWRRIERFERTAITTKSGDPVYANQLRNWEGILDYGGLTNAKSDSEAEDQSDRVPVESCLLGGLIPAMDDKAEEGFWAAVTGNGEKADEKAPAKVEQPLGAQEVILIPLDMIEELFGAIIDAIKVG